MANYANLKAQLDANIYQNDLEAITGSVLNAQLKAMVDALGAGYQFMGVATPSTDPGAPDQKVFYLASQPGTYTNFLDSSSNAIIVNDGEVCALVYSTSWSKLVTGAATNEKLVELSHALDNFTGYKDDKTYSPGPSRLNVYYDREIIGGGRYKVTFVSCTNNEVTSFRLYRMEGTTQVGSYSTIQLGASFELTPESNVNAFRFYTSGSIAEGIVLTIRVEYAGAVIPGEKILDNSFDISKIKQSQIDAKPILGSNNLIRSNGVAGAVSRLVDDVEIDTDVDVVASASRIFTYIENISQYAGQKVSIAWENVSGDYIDYVVIFLYDEDGQQIDSFSLYEGNPRELVFPNSINKILVFRNHSFSQDSQYECKLTSFSFFSQKFDELSKSSFPLKGKKIVSFGDSIWEFVTGNKGIIEYLKELSGNETIFKGAIGGSRLVVRRTPVLNPADAYGAYAALDISYLVNAWANNSWEYVDNAVLWLKNNTEDDNTQIIQNLKNCPISQADIVLLAGGTNDFKNGIALGNKTSSDASNMCGALASCIHSILAVNPKIKIFVMSPIVRYLENTQPPQPDNWGDVWENSNNVTLAEASDELIATAKYHHIPACDLYWGLGWNQDNFLQFFPATDLTHPMNGFDVIAQKVYSYLVSHI